MSKPNQDALALAVSYVPDLGHFVAGPNAELLDHVRRIGKEASGFRSLHLWGVEGAGKSFLCECVRSMASTSQRLEIHDDIDKASVKEQEQYLHAFNQLQATRQGPSSIAILNRPRAEAALVFVGLYLTKSLVLSPEVD